MRLDQITQGMRVRLTTAVGEYPITPVPAGASGTVIGITGHGVVAVTLDVTFPDLAEWDNEIHVGQTAYGGFGVDNEGDDYPLDAITDVDDQRNIGVDEITAFMTARGFTIEQQGGNCTAWQKTLIECDGNDVDMLVTDDNLSHATTSAETIQIGIREHGDAGLFGNTDGDPELFAEFVAHWTLSMVGAEIDRQESAFRAAMWGERRAESVQVLARRFAQQLRDDIGLANVAEVNRYNEIYNDPGFSCASHDFVDANETMITAFKSVFGQEMFAEDQTEEQAAAETHMVNEAWGVAKANKFWPAAGISHRRGWDVAKATSEMAVAHIESCLGVTIDPQGDKDAYDAIDAAMLRVVEAHRRGKPS